MSPEEIRQAVVDEAHSWLRTPYHHQARIKGVGVDCVWLLIEVFKTVGIVAPVFDPGNYSGEWYFHHDEEIYMSGIASHGRTVEKPQIGDIALYKFGRCVSHGVIIVETSRELMGIHASRPAGNVELIELRSLEDRFHSYWSAIP